MTGKRLETGFLPQLSCCEPPVVMPGQRLAAVAVTRPDAGKTGAYTRAKSGNGGQWFNLFLSRL